jgi:hypothetical protein
MATTIEPAIQSIAKSVSFAGYHSLTGADIALCCAPQKRLAGDGGKAIQELTRNDTKPRLWFVLFRVSSWIAFL